MLPHILIESCTGQEVFIDRGPSGILIEFDDNFFNSIFK